jgi:hypothetical protein
MEGGIMRLGNWVKGFPGTAVGHTLRKTAVTGGFFLTIPANRTKPGNGVPHNATHAFDES